MKKISVSILSIKDNIKENIELIDNLDIDYIHLDIMDGNFVPNRTWEANDIEPFISKHVKPLDVHLMVSDLKRYIDDYARLSPEYITFHLEASSDPINVINYIHRKDIKAGISIKPGTDTEELLPYLSSIDLILVMSVEPGKGGQSYISSINEKIDELELFRKAYKYDYVIEVDGGINSETIKECSNADMFVVGSYITDSDNYEQRVKELKSSI
jgi:ribulose-phosphate 3-epimerase